jgi:hypothetical protein
MVHHRVGPNVAGRQMGSVYGLVLTRSRRPPTTASEKVHILSLRRLTCRSHERPWLASIAPQEELKGVSAADSRPEVVMLNEPNAVRY